MRRVSEIVGKPIVSAETGDRLGSVSDALFDQDGATVVGLVLGGGMFGKEHVLPFEDVQTLGGDTVLARSQSHVVAANEWRRAGSHATRASTLRGKPVVSAAGQRLGEVSDLLVNERTGAFDGIEVAAHRLGGLRTERSIVRASPQMRIGPDAVVVPENALDDDPTRDESTSAAERS